MRMLNEIQTILREFFDDETITITENTTSKNIEGWDSMAQMNIIVLMEKHFHMKFKIDEIVELQNIGEMMKIIQSRI